MFTSAPQLLSGLFQFTLIVLWNWLDMDLCFSGKETVHQLFGTRVAVLAGDFMFAQSSWYLANLENLEVIKLISQVKLTKSKVPCISLKKKSVENILSGRKECSAANSVEHFASGF